MATSNARKLLLDEGLRVVSEKGIRGLVVREVAARAGVNLGSFVYHFGTREKFAAELQELWYGPMYLKLKFAGEEDSSRTALENLRVTLERLIELIRENAGFIRQLMADALAGESAARSFLSEVPGRHPKLVLERVRMAQEEGAVMGGDPIQIMFFLFSSAAGPLIAAGMLRGELDWLPPRTGEVLALLNDPDAAKRRLGWALKGVLAETSSGVEGDSAGPVRPHGESSSKMKFERSP